jgi:nucleoside-diphosphate-sugar epimerase
MAPIEAGVELPLLPRIELHLPARLPAADAGRVPADRPLEPTNEPYAIAKIAGIKLCESYNRQYGRRYFSVMPTNLYGPNDNYDLANSHVCRR